jgi:hypothetical protein
LLHTSVLVTDGKFQLGEAGEVERLAALQVISGEKIENSVPTRCTALLHELRELGRREGRVRGEVEETGGGEH